MKRATAIAILARLLLALLAATCLLFAQHGFGLNAGFGSCFLAAAAIGFAS